ncbi:hypothetical protein [Streptomyces luteireticuli]|uniref:hypothetical protein n=1 Tax=Streptomyces luteireticuli TaxID=173858 RepID=UPI003558F561
MAKWWKFGLGRGKGSEEEGRPAEAPPAAEPAEPAEPAAPKAEKGPGLLGRLFGRGRKKEAPPEEAPPTAPAAPPAPPAPPSPPAPPTPAEGPEEGPEEGVEEAPEPEEERVYPDSVTASVDGTWVISDSVWHGVISGTMYGADAKAFIIAMEKGREHTAIALLARAYDDQDMGFARYLDIKSSSWGTIDYS